MTLASDNRADCVRRHYHSLHRPRSFLRRVLSLIPLLYPPFMPSPTKIIHMSCAAIQISYVILGLYIADVLENDKYTTHLLAFYQTLQPVDVLVTATSINVRLISMGERCTKHYDHNLKVQSEDEETRLSSAGLNSTLWTASSWPLSSAIIAMDTVSNTWRQQSAQITIKAC